MPLKFNMWYWLYCHCKGKRFSKFRDFCYKKAELEKGVVLIRIKGIWYAMGANDSEYESLCKLIKAMQRTVDVKLDMGPYARFWTGKPPKEEPTNGKG